MVEGLRGSYCLSKRMTRMIVLPAVCGIDHRETKVEERGQEEVIARVQARDETVLNLGGGRGDKKGYKFRMYLSCKTSNASLKE